MRRTQESTQRTQELELRLHEHYPATISSATTSVILRMASAEEIKKTIQDTFKEMMPQIVEQVTAATAPSRSSGTSGGTRKRKTTSKTPESGEYK